MEAIIKKGKYIGELISAPLEAAKTSIEAGCAAGGITGAAIFTGVKATVGVAVFSNPFALGLAGAAVLASGGLAARAKSWDNQHKLDERRHQDSLTQQTIDREWKIYHDKYSLAIYACIYSLGSAGTCYGSAKAVSSLSWIACLGHISSAIAVAAAGRATYLTLYPVKNYHNPEEKECLVYER